MISGFPDRVACTVADSGKRQVSFLAYIVPIRIDDLLKECVFVPKVSNITGTHDVFILRRAIQHAIPEAPRRLVGFTFPP